MDHLKKSLTASVPRVSLTRPPQKPTMAPAPSISLDELPPYKPDPRDDEDPLAPPQELRDFAYKLISETYELRHAALREMRQKIALFEVEQKTAPKGNKQPVEVGPTDDDFLLMFLRCKKFRVQMAFQEYSNFCRAHSENPWLKDVDIALVEQLFSSGSFQVLPTQDKKGRLVMSMNLKVLGPLAESLGKDRSEDLLAAIMAMVETISGDMRAQIFGVVIVADLTGLKMRTFGCLTVSEYLLSLDLCQHCYPLRARGMYFVHEPWFVKGLFNVMWPFMKPTVKENFQSFGNDVNKIHKYIPKESLPREYSGDLLFDEAANTKYWVDAVRRRVP